MITNRVILAPMIIVFITIIAISLIQNLFFCVCNKINTED